MLQYSEIQEQCHKYRNSESFVEAHTNYSHCIEGVVHCTRSYLFLKYLFHMFVLCVILASLSIYISIYLFMCVCEYVE